MPDLYSVIEGVECGIIKIEGNITNWGIIEFLVFQRYNIFIVFPRPRNGLLYPPINRE